MRLGPTRPHLVALGLALLGALAQVSGERQGQGEQQQADQERAQLVGLIEQQVQETSSNGSAAQVLVQIRAGRKRIVMAQSVGQLDELAARGQLELLLEASLKRDPASRLVVMANESAILVARRLNKYYYWEFGQTAGALLIFCMIVIGNLSILHRLKSCRRRRSNVNYFIVQLAIADLFVGVFNVTLDSVFRLQKAFTYGLFACKASKYISVVFIYSSTYLLVALSIDRWEAVVKPLAFTRNRNRGHYLVMSAWFLAFLSATPVTMRTHIKQIDGLPQCWIELNLLGWKIYMIYLISSVLLVPALIIAICYIHIVYTIWRKGRLSARPDSESRRLQAPAQSPKAASKTASSSESSSTWSLPVEGSQLPAIGPAPSSDEHEHEQEEKQEASDLASSAQARPQPGKPQKRAYLATQPQTQLGRKHGTGVIPQARIKTIKMTLVIVAAFILCWSPFCIINLCSVFGMMPTSNQSLSIALMTLSQSLAHLNSAVNPIIFWIFSSKQNNQEQSNRTASVRRSAASSEIRSSQRQPDQPTTPNSEATHWLASIICCRSKKRPVSRPFPAPKLPIFQPARASRSASQCMVFSRDINTIKLDTLSQTIVTKSKGTHHNPSMSAKRKSLSTAVPDGQLRPSNK